MLVIIIVLSCISIISISQLFLLSRNIRRLTKDFKEAKSNTSGEQHVCIQSPDRELEALAEMLNEYIATYFSEQSNHKRVVKSIRNEITNLSHDLRTPLTSILGYMDCLEGDMLTEEQTEAVQVIRKRTYYLNQLVEELYEYVRLENEDYALKWDKIDIYKLLKEHLLEFYSDFEQNRVELQVEFPKREEPVWIRGDVNFIERILHNITSNVIKYSGGNAKITFEHNSKYVKIIYRTLRGELTQYDIKHLFERFYKKDLSGNKIQASGLGLTIAKRYTEQMGGYAEASGDSTFLYLTFYLKV